LRVRLRRWISILNPSGRRLTVRIHWKKIRTGDRPRDGPAGVWAKKIKKKQKRKRSLFDAADDFEHPDENSILDDVLRYINHPHSPGNRYTGRTWQWTFKLLRTRGSKVFKMIRGPRDGLGHIFLSVGAN
jgi:hypothetical protein